MTSTEAFLPEGKYACGETCGAAGGGLSGVFDIVCAGDLG